MFWKLQHVPHSSQWLGFPKGRWEAALRWGQAGIRVSQREVRGWGPVGWRGGGLAEE